MQQTNKLRVLDECLCMYVSSKDPSKKSSMNNVFMNKNQLKSFYSKIFSKAKQQYMIKHNKNPHQLNQQYFDSDKLLIREQNRKYNKIYNRAFGEKNDNNILIIKMQDKQNIKMNTKSMITQMAQNTQGLTHLNAIQNCKDKNNSSLKTITNLQKTPSSKFLRSANQQLLQSEYMSQNQDSINNKKSISLRKNSVLPLMNTITNKFEYKKNKSLSNYEGSQDDNKRLFNSKKNKYYLQTQQFDSGSCMSHCKVQLFQLYQKIYEHFTEQKKNDDTILNSVSQQVRNDSKGYRHHNMNNLANINTMNKNVKNKSPGISINDIQTKNKIKKKLLLL